MIETILFGGLFVYTLVALAVMGYELYLRFFTDQDTSELQKLTWMMVAGIFVYLIGIYLLGPAI